MPTAPGFRSGDDRWRWFHCGSSTLLVICLAGPVNRADHVAAEYLAPTARSVAGSPSRRSLLATATSAAPAWLP